MFSIYFRRENVKFTNKKNKISIPTSEKDSKQAIKEQTKKQRKSKKEKKHDKKKGSGGTLPWWCKIFAYILSYLFAGISIFFIIVRGISFGNDLCTKWLTSVLISLFTSLFLTQPLQVKYSDMIVTIST